MAASILEAALRAIAEKRGYPLSQDPKRRTFGNVIRAWELNSLPRQEVAAIWPDIKAMQEVRNLVHLHKAAQEDKSWEGVLAEEHALLQGALNAISHVSQIEA